MASEVKVWTLNFHTNMCSALSLKKKKKPIATKTTSGEAERGWECVITTLFDLFLNKCGES